MCDYMRLHLKQLKRTIDKALESEDEESSLKSVLSMMDAKKYTIEHHSCSK